MVGGVAGGLAKRLGISVTVIRAVLIITTISGGFGAAAYAVAWLVVPMEGAGSSIASRAITDRRGIAMVVALVPALVLVLVVGSALKVPYLATASWTCFASAAGLILVYRNAEEPERSWIRQSLAPLAELGSGRNRSRRTFVLRVIAGLLAALVGVILLLIGHSTVSALRPVSGALLLIAAVVILFGPWWLHLARELVTERQARARAEERADMAARVHDSVLQTLALIQRAADDPQRVNQLARSQERELRSWLFEGATPRTGAASRPDTLTQALELVAREAEELHQISVENVTVGDCPLDDDLRAMVAAAREATMNSAKWSGAPVVSIYAEVEPQRVTAYVRDRGRGFERSEVAADRRGISESIRGRMARHGGVARVTTRPGQGTEVALAMPRSTKKGAA